MTEKISPPPTAYKADQVLSQWSNRKLLREMCTGHSSPAHRNSTEYIISRCLLLGSLQPYLQTLPNSSAGNGGVDPAQSNMELAGDEPELQQREAGDNVRRPCDPCDLDVGVAMPAEKCHPLAITTNA